MTNKKIIKELRTEIDKILQTGKSLRSYRIYQYLDMLEKDNPTISECIKEWEERGFEVRENSRHYLFLINYDKNIKVLFRKFELSYKVEDFYDDEDSCVISYELHNLIHKTLKALEVNKNGN